MKTRVAAAMCILISGDLLSPAPAIGQERSGVEAAGYFGSSALLPSMTEPFREGLNIGLGLSGVRNARITESGGSSFKWLAGGGVAVPVTGSLLIVGEYAYNRVGSAAFQITIPGRATGSASVRVGFTDFTGGVHYQFRSAGRKVIPFVGGGVGIVRATVSGDSQPMASAVSASTTDMTMNGGGGLRVFVGKNWGLRPEIKVVRVPDDTYLRACIGLFYQFGSGKN